MGNGSGLCVPDAVMVEKGGDTRALHKSTSLLPRGSSGEYLRRALLLRRAHRDRPDFTPFQMAPITIIPIVDINHLSYIRPHMGGHMGQGP